jgi:SEC-C motif domain protein
VITIVDTERCPCRKKTEAVTYGACCGRYHHGAVPVTPEALMRSRYTAFSLHNAPYLLSTWHPSTRPATIDFEAGRDWYMLKIIAAAETGDTGTVSFAARSRLGGRTWTLEEVSRFIRENGRWYYVEGLTNA